MIDPIISALSDLVGRYGGYVEKFAGDALLALFGAPIAHEDDATRALEVSIEMHRALERLRVTLGANGEGLTLHIGIASGRGIARMIGSKVRMDYAVLGDSVILAQRLESATPSGETYLSQSTREIVRDRFELEPVPPLTLKGKAEPVPAWRLLGPKRAAEQGSGLAGRRHAPLLGRAHEVARLRDAIDALADGAGAATVGIVGEPGVGKSRLVEEARRIAAERGVAWLDARCLSYGSALPYWPIADLLRRELDLAGNETADADAIKALDGLPVPGAGSFVATLLGIAPSAELGDLEPEAFRRGLHDAVRAWLEARAAERGLVLAIEDVHWADASTLDFLADLASAPDGVGLAIWATSRPPAPAWLSGEGSEAASPTLLETRELDEEAIGELVDHVLGRPSSRAFQAMVAERSAGNPFFAEEIVRSLSESDALAEGPEGRWGLRKARDADDVPATIEGVLSARLDALGPTAQRTLAVGSVIGRRVDLRLLEGVLDGNDASSTRTCGRSSMPACSTRSTAATRSCSSTMRSLPTSRTAGFCGAGGGSSIGARPRRPRRCTVPATRASTSWRGTSIWRRPGRGRSTTSSGRPSGPGGSSRTTRRSSTSSGPRSSRRATQRRPAFWPGTALRWATSRSWSERTTTPRPPTGVRSTPGPMSAPGEGSHRCTACAGDTPKPCVSSTRRSPTSGSRTSTCGRCGSNGAGTSPRRRRWARRSPRWTRESRSAGRRRLAGR